MLRCRQILESDLPAVVDLLMVGLPGRSRAFWESGFARLSSRILPPNLPRYGVVLEASGRLVGLVIMIHSLVDGRLRCNLSSWYVDPRYRSFASVMVNSALRNDVLYLNVSPNPNTWPVIEAQGFRRYVLGETLSLLFIRAFRRCRVRAAKPTDEPVLVDHASYGCISLVVEVGELSMPFVFVKETRTFGWLRMTVANLLYSRDGEDYRRYAGPIGRYLLRSGVLVAASEANGNENDSFFDHFTASSGPRYYRGSSPPRLGDLAYSEWAIFGPGLRGRGRLSLKVVFKRALVRARGKLASL